jgi:O-antigen/teichoic acid export membrane protein
MASARPCEKLGALRRLSTNVFANLAGQGWVALVQIVTVPVYLRLLGPEGYGVVALYATLQGALLVLDLGITPMLSREVARLGARVDTRPAARPLVLTWAAIYAGLTVLVTVALLAAAEPIARLWLRGSTISGAGMAYYIRLMAILAGLQFPVSLCTGILTGLERQIEANLLRAAAATLAAGGAIAVLTMVARTPSAFFAWHIAVALLQLAAAVALVLHHLPPGPFRFAWGLVTQSWRFAAGMAGLAATSLLFTQADRLVLSMILPLDQFAFYSVAYSGARGLYVLVTPVFGPLFARLSALVAAGDESAVRRLYHQSSQALGVTVLPLAAAAAAFAPEIMRAWTRDERAVASASAAFALLVIGNAVNGVMHAPFALQLSHGWTKLTLGVNVVLLCLVVPAIAIVSRRYGSVGAAAVWLVLNCATVVAGVPLTHRRLLKGDTGRWLLRDMAGPGLAAVIVVLAGRRLVPAGDPLGALWAAVAAAAGGLAALAAATDLRRLAMATVSRPSSAALMP